MSAPPGNRALRLLGVVQATGSAAEWMWYTSATVYAYELDGVGAVGVIATAAVLPAALLAPLLSYLIDRFPRHRVLTGAVTLRTLAVGLAAVSFYSTSSVALLALFTAVEGVATLLVRPATTALLPFLTHRPSELVSAQARLGAIENGGLLTGSIAAGVLLTVTSPGVAFAVATATAVTAVLASVAVPVEATEERPAVGEGVGAVVRQSLAGFPAIVRDRAWVVSAVAFAALLVSGATDVLVVATAFDLLGLSELGPGLLTACIGIGGVAGAAVMARTGSRRMAPWLLLAAGLIGVPLALIGGLPFTAVVLALMAAVGAGQTITLVAGQTQLQRLVDETRLGRALGIAEAVGFAFTALGAALTPVLIDAIGLDWTLVVIGSVAPVVVVALGRQLRGVDHTVERGLAEIEALDGIAFLAPLPNVARARIAARVETLHVPAGEAITFQGGLGDAFYIVDDGFLDVFVDGDHVRTLGPDDFFGELALLSDEPRTATVRAREPTSLRGLHRRDFLMVVTGHASLGRVVSGTADERRLRMPAGPQPSADHRTEVHALLASVPLLAYLGPGAIDQLAERATSVHYADDETVYGEGQDADAVYVVVRGEVEQLVDGERDRVLGPGMSLGEPEVLRGRPRPVTAVAGPDTEVLRLPGELVRDMIEAV